MQICKIFVVLILQDSVIFSSPRENESTTSLTDSDDDSDEVSSVIGVELK
jgi:hypothetical protein